MQSKSIGTVLIALGILMMIYTGFTYKTKERVVDIGPIKINAEKNHPISWPPVVGVILLIGGVIVISGGKKNSI
jgi:uncharacterized membrane protein YidH (DUF202 family)